MDKYSPVIVASADLHGHLYTPHSRVDENGYNTRLVVCAKAVWEIGEFISSIRNDEEDEWYDSVRQRRVLHFFCGDWIHSRMAVNTVVGNLLRNSLDCLVNGAMIDTYASIGNHDMYLRKDGEVSLSMFEPLLQVKSGECQFTLSTGEVLYVSFIPYTADQNELRSLLKAAKVKKGDKNILIAHTGLREAIAGAYGYRMKDELPVAELKELEYDWCFVGHYHIPQDFGDGVIIPGSLVQHNFGERGVPHGFYVVNLVDESYRFVPTNSPQFIQDEMDHVPAEPYDEWKGNYVKLVFTDVDLYNQSQVFIEDYKAQGVLSVVRELKRVSKFEKTTDNQVEYGMSLSEMVSSFVNQWVDEKEREAVLAKGLQLLKTVESES